MAVRVDDAGLVAATLEGDPAAFGELAGRYRDAAFGIAFHRLGNFEAARDVAQEALVTAYVELPMLREPAKFAHWLCRITTMAALTELRRRRPTLSLDGPDAPEPSAGPDPAEALERSEKAREVQEALALLPEPDRLAVILHYVNGYSHEEIGGILGTTESAVKNRVHRARRRLREEMREMVESSLKSEAQEVQYTEELVRLSLLRFPEVGWAVLEHARVPFGLRITDETRQAVAKVAAELADDGYQCLVGLTHIPDGSPALAMFRGIGFTTHQEMRWFERPLKGRLPKVPPLDPRFEVRPLLDADPAALAEVMRANYPGAPIRADAELLRHLMSSEHLVPEASLAAYAGDRVAAYVLTNGIKEEHPMYPPLSADLWHAYRHPELGTAGVLAHVIASVLRPLKAAGYRHVVKAGLQSGHPPEDELIEILQSLGFRYIRSLWNLKLDLQAWREGRIVSEAPTTTECGAEQGRVMRPLRFSSAECPVQDEAAQAIEVRIDRVLGTSPMVAPGEVYIATGEYTLSGPSAAEITLANDGTSRGHPTFPEPGTHTVTLPAEILAVTPGKERVLYVNLMGLGPKAVTRVKIELEGWGE